jgi:hypothetical protein
MVQADQTGNCGGRHRIDFRIGRRGAAIQGLSSKPSKDARTRYLNLFPVPDVHHCGVSRNVIRSACPCIISPRC